ncbi:Small integral membrane protein 15 [Bulinus truncatus]|nr:Small integral membrane protein 15 [Bulinus truncatus]
MAESYADMRERYAKLGKQMGLTKKSRYKNKSMRRLERLVIKDGPFVLRQSNESCGSLEENKSQDQKICSANAEDSGPRQRKLLPTPKAVNSSGLPVLHDSRSSVASQCLPNENNINLLTMVVVYGYDLKDVLHSTLKFAATNPWQFIYYVLLILSPLFLISAILAWKLAKEIQHKEKDKKRKAKREANIARTRRQKVD